MPLSQAMAGESQTPAERRGSMMLTSPAPMFKPDDIYIAVMGVTGAGKSTFISKLCPGAVAGHGLKSETKEIAVYTFQHADGKTVHLIDTPGFDDTYKSDTDVLKDLAYYLAKSYREGLLLTGIIYLHPITHNRLNGTAFKNLRTFRKLCGEQGVKSVILVTTMWESVHPASLGAERETELVDTAEFWGDMKRNGSEVRRHMNSRESAVEIISFLVARGNKTILGLQTEMVDQSRSLENTEAGKEVDREMQVQREVFERRLEDTKQELQEAIKEKDVQHVDEVLKEQAKFEAKLAAIQRGRDELRISMEKLIAEKDKEHIEEMTKVKEQLTGAEETLKKQVEEYQNFKKFQEAQTQQHEAQKKEAEEKYIALQQYAQEADITSIMMAVSVLQQEAKGKQLEQEKEADMKQMLMVLALQKQAAESKGAPPPYQDTAYQPPMNQYQYQYQQPAYGQYGQPMPQQGYNEGVGAGVGGTVGAMSGLALGGAAALGMCIMM